MVVWMSIGLKFAVCLDGANASPPEDCGGLGGYEDLLRVVADPSHEEHDHMLGWPADPSIETPSISWSTPVSRHSHHRFGGSGGVRPYEH